MTLQAWLEGYIQNRQIVLGPIQKKEDSGQFITVEFRSRTQIYFCLETLETLPPLSDEFIVICTLNTLKNVKSLVSHWSALSMYPKLLIIFVNTSTNQRWAIYPHTHNKVTESATLLPGLISLAEGVGYT